MYDGTHSITFVTTDGSEEVNTWTDWFLIPESRPSISMPATSNKYVEIPGMNGSYDLSDYPAGVTYADRSGSFEFIIDNDHIDWVELKRMITTFLHGRKLRMIFSDDPEWYFEGRFTLDNFSSEQTNSKVVITYRVSPFRLPVQQ